MGVKNAFYPENIRVMEALSIAQVQKGGLTNVRREAAAERATQASSSDGDITSRSAMPTIGPRGGFPRTKAALEQLCVQYHLSLVGTILAVSYTHLRAHETQ